MTTNQDGAAGNGLTASSSPLGKIQRIDDRTVIVLGQELNVDAKQPTSPTPSSIRPATPS